MKDGVAEQEVEALVLERELLGVGFDRFHADVKLVSGGQIVAKMLKQEGVKHIFTISGGHIIDIYNGDAYTAQLVIDCSGYFASS